MKGAPLQLDLYPEDLYGLLKLTGGDKPAVISHIAKVYGVQTESIADTVKSWLDDLPAIPPPSRQRSAPPAAPVACEIPLGLTRAAPGAARAAEVLSIREPPASAPVRQSSGDLIKTMAALNARISKPSARTRIRYPNDLFATLSMSKACFSLCPQITRMLQPIQRYQSTTERR